MCRDCDTKTCKILPRLGVRLDFLERFIEDEKIPEDWTTEDVVKKIIIRNTKPHQRYTDVIELDYPEEAYVGPLPTVFISHAWSRRFVELVESLTRGRVFGMSNRKRYVWLDIFTVHQHDGPLKQLDLMTITECIRTIGYTAVILDDGLDYENIESRRKCALLEDISKPVALSRIWCLSEIWNTIRFGGHVQFINTGFFFGGVGYCGWFNRRPFEVTCLNAQATKEKDLAWILAEMEQAEVVCEGQSCDGSMMKALPYKEVLELLNIPTVENQEYISEEQIEELKRFLSSECVCSCPDDFKYYVLFCEKCKKVVCRKSVINDRRKTMITWVDKTINDGILQLWAEQRFYLIYPVVAIILFVVGGIYAIRETLLEDLDATTIGAGLVYGVLSFVVITMGILIFSCLWQMTRITRCPCPSVSENFVLVLYCMASLVFLVVLKIRIFLDKAANFESYVVLGYLACFLIVFFGVLYLYRKRSLTKNFRMNIAPGSWIWFFSFCWFYYPICLSWLLCDCVWIKGNRHRAPRKFFKNTEAFCFRAFELCCGCCVCGRPRGESYGPNRAAEQNMEVAIN